MISMYVWWQYIKFNVLRPNLTFQKSLFIKIYNYWTKRFPKTYRLQQIPTSFQLEDISFCWIDTVYFGDISLFRLCWICAVNNIASKIRGPFLFCHESKSFQLEDLSSCWIEIVYLGDISMYRLRWIEATNQHWFKR